MPRAIILLCCGLWFFYTRILTGYYTLGLIMSQVKDIVTHAQMYKAVKCIFCGVWVQILCEISKVSFEISHKILNPYTAKYVFYEVLKVFRIMIS